MGDKEVIRKYLYNQESDKIGGVLLLLLGPQGSGKTVGLWQKTIIDFNQDRVCFWRGQENCSWIGLAANDIPVTLWMHESINDYEFIVRGSKREGIPAEEIDIEEAEDVDVEVRQFGSAEELVDDAEVDRVNVFYFPGEKSQSEIEYYFFLEQQRALAEELNERDWGDDVTKIDDEFGNVGTEDDSKPYHRLVKYALPSEFADFRKNGINEIAAAHSTSEIHYKFWDVKFNNIMYMSGASVKNTKTPQVDQQAVNNLSRGHFVISEGMFDKDHFTKPTLPHEGIEWMPRKKSRKMIMRMEADIPNIVPQSEQENLELEDSILDRSDLDEFITSSTAAEMLEIANSSVRRKIRKNQIPAIKVNSRHLLSLEQILEIAES
jgi:uncharacterized protein (UPF0248 family)